MKKNTFTLVLALVLLSFNLHPQPFPAPYCEILDPDGVTVE